MSAPGGPPSAGPGGAYGGQGHHGSNAGVPTGSASAGQGGSSASDLNKIVTDYLLKKGFTKTESAFRKESSHLGADGRPQHSHVNDMGPEKYWIAFALLKKWIDGNLDMYKWELSKLLWPVFVYSYLIMIEDGLVAEAKEYLEKVRSQFESYHADNLRTLSTITLPVHIRENETTKLYREHKYSIPLNSAVSGQLMNFLERESENGGVVIIDILASYCKVNAMQRGPMEPFSFEAVYQRTNHLDIDEADVNEGIPGVFTGITNRDILDHKAKVRLGPLRMEQEMREEVREELENLDIRHPPAAGVPSLTEEFDQKIKREDSAEDGHTRDNLPLPASRARDIVMEIAKVKENRDRFKIEGRTGGIGPPVSCTMYTFHNTNGTVSSMAFTKDHKIAAYGTMESYIRLWSMDGKPLKGPNGEKWSNKKLIGHSAPVYGLSFSDAIHTPADMNPYEGESETVETGAKLLLSSSGDGTVRLWHLQLYSCLVVYKAHQGPCWRVLWGPHGHYFMTAGWDKTVRIFMQDHMSAKRILVGHDTSVSAIAWHPNGVYVFSASDETDKTIRMWSIQTGTCVRVFTGHTDYIGSLACAPNGKILASGDAGGNIFWWDLEKGTRIKRSRGHAKGGIPSLSFGVESTVLASGGLDGTVRIWETEMPKPLSEAPTFGNVGGSAAQGLADGSGAAGDTVMVGGGQDRTSITVGGGQAAPTAAPTGAAGGTGTGKKKGKEVMVTADQISAWPTKRTPVMLTEFTRMNLVIAGGCHEG